MRYEIPFMYHGDTAKTVGIIASSRPNGPMAWVILEAANDEAAFAAVVKKFSLTDRKKRPVSGKSNVRRWRANNVALNNGLAPLNMIPQVRIGDRIVLHAPHGCTHSEDGKGYRVGVVSEILTTTHFGITLDGYPRMTDFNIREFAVEG